MPAKNRQYELRPELLHEYRDAALVNAQALLDEAKLLLKHRHFARAYFLAASCIEEAGKAVQAFEGLGRNLSDPAVAQRLKLQFEDHSQKVAAAFSPWLQATPDLREQVMDFVRIMVDLQFGREASMYTDIDSERVIVTTPQQQIQSRIAANSVALASTVLAHAHPYAKQSLPKRTTRAQDEFFALRTTVFQKMANTADFWHYYLSQMESGSMELEQAVIGYNRLFLSKGILFKPDLEPDAQ